MNKRLFVGSLPFDFTNDQLQQLFTPLGQVLSAEMVWDKKNQRTRGFGFVEMSTEDEARAAMEKMNGSSVGSKPIWVTEARPKEERPTAAPAAARPSLDKQPGGAPPIRRERSVPFRDRRPGLRGRRFGPPGARDPNRIFSGPRGPQGAGSEPRRPFGRRGDAWANPNLVYQGQTSAEHRGMPRPPEARPDRPRRDPPRGGFPRSRGRRRP